MKKFWTTGKAGGSGTQASGEEMVERVLFLNGTIAEESWYDDEVTPALFKEELMAGSGNITVWNQQSGWRLCGGCPDLQHADGLSP